jgi:PAS domain S-box-containing protein
VSIRARIFTVVGVVIAGAFVQTLVVLQIEGRRGATAAAMDRALWRYENQSRLGRLVVELESVQRSWLMTGSAAQRAEFERVWDLYERTGTLLPQYIDEPDAKRDLASLDGLIREWHLFASPAPASTPGPGLPPRGGAGVEAARPPGEAGDPRMRRIRSELDRFETRERNHLAEQRTASNSQALQSTLLTLGIPALAIVILLLLVAFVARILLDPLAAVANSAHQISGGNFDVSLPPASRDEIGALVHAFRDMITAVQRRQREVTEALAREREQSEISATLRTKAEREHQQLLATIETVPVALVIVDAASGRIALQNKTAGLLVGREPEGDAEREAYWNAFRVTTREGAPLLVREWGVERLMQGAVVAGEELVVHHPDGREIPILVSAAPLRGDDGTIAGGVVAFQDITSLYEVDRLKSEFVSIVSHELRTPLTSIKGALQLLLDEASAADPDHVMLMNVALSNTDRLVRIINDILDVSKIEAGKLELNVRPHQVAEVVTLSLQNVEQIAHGSLITLTSSIEAGVPAVLVDLDRTIQVVVNLLSNALKFAPPRSEVTLSARRDGNGFVAFDVTDHGKGIPPEKIGLLFQKFQQLDGASTRTARGTGLGLAIVKALVEMQGGRVSVDSAVGRGSTFTVTVPVVGRVASSQ